MTSLTLVTTTLKILICQICSRHILLELDSIGRIKEGREEQIFINDNNFTCSVLDLAKLSYLGFS